MADQLRVVVADDERPARSFLIAHLRALIDVNVVGQATDGTEAVRLIEEQRPDLAFLDLQMPGVDGLGVVRLLKRRALPLVVFVTAYDEYAVKAFELNAVDYLTKPVSETRLREALRRARERLERADLREAAVDDVDRAVATYDAIVPASRLDRIPVRRKDDIVLLPVTQIASVVADGELLHFTTVRNERYTISHRLKDLEARLDPARFVRLSRGALANVDHVVSITPLPGTLYSVRLSNGQELDVSRIQSRVLRGRLLKL